MPIVVVLAVSLCTNETFGRNGLRSEPMCCVQYDVRHWEKNGAESLGGLQPRDGPFCRHGGNAITKVFFSEFRVSLCIFGFVATLIRRLQFGYRSKTKNRHFETVAGAVFIRQSPVLMQYQF